MDDEEVLRFEITDRDLAEELDPNVFSRRRNQTREHQIYGVWAESDDDERPGPSTSRGSSSKGGMISFVSGGLQKTKEEQAEEAKDKEDKGSSSSSEDEVEFVKFAQLDMTAGLRNNNPTKGLEMYGKGAKMAMAMGFQPGKGLGKELQGIHAPIVAAVRKGRGAIGLYGKEKQQAPALQPTMKEEPKKKGQASQWKKTEGKRVEYRVITADEVLEKKTYRVRTDGGALAKVKVIDMRGPEERVLSGYHAISGQQRPADEETPKASFHLDELLHNLSILKSKAEDDILRKERGVRERIEQKEVNEEELTRLGDRLEKEHAAEERVKRAIVLLENLNDSPNLLLSLAKIKRECPEEWELHDLSSLVPALATPIIKDELRLWDPLRSPVGAVEILMDWGGLLPTSSVQYHALLWEAWMPSIRSGIIRWNTKDPEPLIELLQISGQLVPPWLIAHILESLVMPKLLSEVEAWDPQSDPVPIHAWLHPWIPVLGSHRLETVYPTIRKKLGAALVGWDPMDASGKEILRPWAEVFTRGAFEAFLVRHILPKLVELVSRVDVAGGGGLEGIFSWADLTPPHIMGQILEKGFFPRWETFLIGWLSQGPDLARVRDWYASWRAHFPPQILAIPAVTHGLAKGLEAMGRALEGGDVPVAPQIREWTIGARAGPGAPDAFRHLVQMKLEEAGILFVPAGRNEAGNALYRCANILMYMSGNVIFAERNGEWIPLSLPSLLSLATQH